MPQAPRQHRPINHSSPRKEYEQRRHSASERGFTVRWHKAKRIALTQMVVDEANPYCRYCDDNEATTLDHGIPPTRVFAVGTADYDELFWNERLWVPACLGCNSVKQDKLPHELSTEMRQRLEAVLQSRGVNWKDYVR